MNKKKGILVVSFGSSIEEARKRAIEPIENLIRETFPEYQVERAFTSFMIINKLKRTQDLHIDTPQEGIQRLIGQGVQEIFIQPLHILAGHEFEKIQRIIEENQGAGVQIKLGKPLLYDEKDYKEAVAALKSQLPDISHKQVVVLVGHGTDHDANTSYALLQQQLKESKLPVIVGTVEADAAGVLTALEAEDYQEIILMPFMVVAGDHVYNDLMGEEPDSWHMQLTAKGYQVSGYPKGLGENPAFRALYIQRVRELLA